MTEEAYMRFAILIAATLACSGCAVWTPAYVDQNSLMVGRLQGEVDGLKWALDRERKPAPTAYLK